MTVNTNMMYEGRFKYLDAGYLQEHDAVFDVEAGDVDGDGVDELFVYAGCYVDENGVRKAVVDMYDLGGGNWKQSVVKIDAVTPRTTPRTTRAGTTPGRSFSQLLSFR